MRTAVTATATRFTRSCGEANADGGEKECFNGGRGFFSMRSGCGAVVFMWLFSEAPRLRVRGVSVALP